jgi:hypothetical protein
VSVWQPSLCQYRLTNRTKWTNIVAVRQAEIQRAADDAAEEAYRESPAGQRELEKNLEWSKENQPEMYPPYHAPGNVYISKKDGKFHRRMDRS